MERWFSGFISANVVFGKDLHVKYVRDAMNSVSVGNDVRVICVISHSEAVILRACGIDGPPELLWRGKICECVSTWISTSDNEQLKAQTRSLECFSNRDI